MFRLLILRICLIVDQTSQSWGEDLSGIIACLAAASDVAPRQELAAFLESGGYHTRGPGRGKGKRLPILGSETRYMYCMIPVLALPAHNHGTVLVDSVDACCHVFSTGIVLGCQ